MMKSLLVGAFNNHWGHDFWDSTLNQQDIFIDNSFFETVDIPMIICSGIRLPFTSRKATVYFWLGNIMCTSGGSLGLLRNIAPSASTTDGLVYAAMYTDPCIVCCNLFDESCCRLQTKDSMLMFELSSSCFRNKPVYTTLCLRNSWYCNTWQASWLRNVQPKFVSAKHVSNAFQSFPGNFPPQLRHDSERGNARRRATIK